jgi:hypothetical protein
LKSFTGKSRFSGIRPLSVLLAGAAIHRDFHAANVSDDWADDVPGAASESIAATTHVDNWLLFNFTSCPAVLTTGYRLMGHFVLKSATEANKPLT